MYLSQNIPSKIVSKIEKLRLIFDIFAHRFGKVNCLRVNELNLMEKVV